MVATDRLDHFPPALPGAACRRPGVDPEWFFPHRGQQTKRAKAVCSDCPERAACLEHWAAMTARHRAWAVGKPRRLTQVAREAVEENTGERFAFTETLPVAADFVPDLHESDVTPEVRGLMETCLVLLNANQFLYLD